jgi:hypothetical protein
MQESRALGYAKCDEGDGRDKGLMPGLIQY